MVWMIFGIIALLVFSIWSLHRDYRRAKEEEAYSQSFEAKVERALARKQETMAIKEEVAKRLSTHNKSD